MEDDLRKYLDPKVLAKISKLDLRARLIVEGFISGLHKSPFHGFSVEFAQHREYVPGDDTRHIDWKVYGKSDRYYIKQYEQETNLKAYILLDVSESMSYTSGGMSKVEYGGCVAASLAYLMLRQQDSVGLALFDEEVREFIRDSGHPSHLKLIVHRIEQTAPMGKTKVRGIFDDLAERIHRRGMVVIISDLFVDPDELLVSLRHFRHKRHEVIIFHVLDEYERTFPFTELTLFKGLEQYPQVFAEPRSLRRDYMAEFKSFIRKVKQGCRQHGIDYVPMTTSDSLEVALSSYLAARMSRTK
ncbi:MAG TPA: DUF58 domain-containing protein [Planctomycetota bacterium]|nr:DUF58 domain-containing protein [Planctomycetota bacterium]